MAALAAQFAAALSPDRRALLHDLSTLANVPLFIVGGFVRDLILGVPVKDFDIVVEGQAIDFAKRVAAAREGTITAHRRFGTAKWTLPPGLGLTDLDFVSARRETYARPAALPEVQFGDIRDDLARRDFTFNTLAIRLDGEHFGELLDIWNGERDLRQSVIRVLHDRSFIDDPTRIFRAVRFEQRFGFQLAGEAASLIPEALSYIPLLSADRIRHELDLILQEAKPERMILRLAELGVLTRVHPALPADSDLPRRFNALQTSGEHVGADPQTKFARVGPSEQIGSGEHTGSPLRWAAWLLPLAPPVLNELINRLRLDGDTAKAVRAASQAQTIIGSLPDGLRFSGLHARLKRIDRDPLRLAIALCTDEVLRSWLAEYLRRRDSLKLATTGDDLKALGLPPGPRYREILSQLQNAYLDGEITNAEDEQMFLGRILGK